jgi:hypothetical protein
MKRRVRDLRRLFENAGATSINITLTESKNAEVVPFAAAKGPNND